MNWHDDYNDHWAMTIIGRFYLLPAVGGFTCHLDAPMHDSHFELSSFGLSLDRCKEICMMHYTNVLTSHVKKLGYVVSLSLPDVKTFSINVGGRSIR